MQSCLIRVLSHLFRFDDAACLLQAQEALLDNTWDKEAVAFEPWKAILGKDATVAFKGPRVKMSIVQDIPTSIGPHPDTGCAMYHGPMAGRSATAVALLLRMLVQLGQCSHVKPI